MLEWLTSGMVVVGALGLLESYMTELEEVVVFFRLYDYSIRVGFEYTMVWLGLRNDTFLVNSFYFSLACRRVELFPYDIVWNS